MARSQLRLFAVAALLRVAASYSCTVAHQCSNRIGGPLTGTKADVQAACDADVNCVAFDYDSLHSESSSYFAPSLVPLNFTDNPHNPHTSTGYGFKCSTTASKSDNVTI